MFHSDSSDEDLNQSRSDGAISHTKYLLLDSCLKDKRVAITWIIENFSYTSEEPGILLRSNYFSCGSAFWCVELYQTDRTTANQSFVAVRLISTSVFDRKKTRFRFCLKSKNGAEYFVKEMETLFGFAGDARRFRLATRKYLRSSGVIVDDVLTLYCELIVLGATVHGEIEFLEEETVNEGPKAINVPRVLCQNLGKIFRNGHFCDVVLKTSQKKFSVHKAVLAARSDVFAAMFVNDMRERNTNEVEVSDVKAGVMRAFLQFLYTGKVRRLTMQKASELLFVADKYAVKDLKDNCLEFLCNGVAMNNFFAMVLLADLHSQPNLKYALIKFFTLNVKRLILSREWDNLVLKRPDLVNEIKKSYLFEL